MFFDEDLKMINWSVLDTRKGEWKNRNKLWDMLGINSIAGRRESVTYNKELTNINNGISKYSNTLCELLYTWYSEENDVCFDPFAGGSVRGLVAYYKKRQYIGYDVRKEQIEANYDNLDSIDVEHQYLDPTWLHRDSSKDMINEKDNSYDFIQTCPPYFDCEIYSNQKDDMSNLKTYDEFLDMYEEIIKNCSRILKTNKYVAWVIGNVRDERGNYRDIRGDTVRMFNQRGLGLYNEYILVNSNIKGTYQSNLFDKTKKNISHHQFVLIFRK